MFWPFRKRASTAIAAPDPAPPLPRYKRDATDGFPRALPDGDRNKPTATGRWPSTDEIAATFETWKPGMFLLGRDHTGRYYGHDDDRHVLTVAGSRAGKGISLVVPNLLFWRGSAVVIDPKAELASLTGPRRSAMGSEWSVPMTPGEGEVYALDPWDRVTGAAREFARASFNPMAGLDPTTSAGLDLANQIADSLIIQSDGDGAHWTQAARALLRVLILFVAATEPPTSKTLITVRRLVTRDGKQRTALWLTMAAMGEQGEQYDLIARTGEAMSGKGNELNSIMSTIETQTAFLEGLEMAKVLSGSSFRLEDLKERRITVYLCLPATRLATHGRWLRLFVTLAMDAMERTGPLLPGRPRVLFCLDEFAALGRMETVEKAAGQIASFGVKLWPIVQDINQLKRDYSDGWETFMGNSGLLTFFGNTDVTTTDHIAKRLGDTEVLRTVVNESQSWQENDSTTIGVPWTAIIGGSPNTNNTKGTNKGLTSANAQSIQRAPLMNGSEIVQAFARETNKLLIMIPDKPPIALHRCIHHSEQDDALFGGLFEEVPGQEKPRTNRARREERDGKADFSA